jgi:hypothetical protein
MAIKEILLAAIMLVAMSGGSLSAGTKGDKPSLCGPHGGRIVKDKYHVFEVRLDKEKHKLDVYALQLQSEPPKNLTVRLYFDPDTSQEVELTAVNYQDPIPHYQGYVSAANDKYVSIGITFRVDLLG